MQDPSAGVAPQLLPYVHLISSFRYPIHQNLSDEDAVNFLLNAPRIVREMAPMVWQYISAGPNDGTVLLAWQPPALGPRFASDGYIWADPEQSYHFETRGLTVEVLVHRSGYRPQIDPISCHSRRRYHIVRKAPSIQQETDPSLWIIHWGPADPAARVPIQRIPIGPDVQKAQHDRMYLMQQGHLVRKEFMLQDRSSWPSINFPGAGQAPAQAYPQQQMQQRAVHPNFYNQPGQVGQAPKRQKVAGPPHVTGAGPPAMAGAVMEALEDEDTALGDYLDHLTPREISTVRYKQHHEWMEEIFSSAYASSQIVPEDLGLGLAGDLQDLTAGILDDALGPSPEPRRPNEKPTKPDELPRQYKKLEATQMEELERRIARFMDDGQSELRAMKTEHAKKIAESRRNKTYIISERKLRNATGPREVESFIAEVESSLGVTVKPRSDVFCVQKGGLEEEDKARIAKNRAANDTANGASKGTALTNGGSEDNASTADMMAANLLDQFGSYANTPDARILTPQMSNPRSQPPSAVQTPGLAGVEDQQADYLQQDGLDGAGGDDGLDLMEGMDLDVDIGDELAEPTIAKPGGEDDWVMVNDQGNATSAAQAGPGADAKGPDTAGANGAKEATDTPADISSASALIDMPDTTGLAGDDNGEQDTDLFAANTDEFTFDGLDTAGDALADFTVGTGDDDLGLDLVDDSAFGEAFVDTETPTGGEAAE